MSLHVNIASFIFSLGCAKVCYGKQDPWTPAPRVEALKKYPPVIKVLALDGNFI